MHFIKFHHIRRCFQPFPTKSYKSFSGLSLLASWLCLMWILVSFLRSELGIFEKPIGQTVNWQFPMGSANNWTNPMSYSFHTSIADQYSIKQMFSKLFASWSVEVSYPTKTCAHHCQAMFQGQMMLKLSQIISYSFIHIPGSVSSMGLAFGQSHWRKISRAKVELE